MRDANLSLRHHFFTVQRMAGLHLAAQGEEVFWLGRISPTIIAKNRDIDQLWLVNLL